MKRRVVIIGCAIIVLLLLVVWYINPFFIFERKLNFVLPNTVLIKNSSYSLFYNELKMKISFDTKEYQSIVKNVIDYAKNNMSEVNLKNGGNAISVRASCIYWEEEKEEAILAYLGFKQGKWGAKTRVTCILITKDKENKGGYFLHVDQ